MDVINKITSEVAQAFDSYLDILSRAGYVSYCDVYKLLVYSFIQEFFEKFPYSISVEDYNSMSNVLDCLYGTCIIPYPGFKEEIFVPDPTIVHDESFRITEDMVLRITEDNSLRLKA